MRRFGWVFLFAMAAACTEEATAPGNCPNFCPGGSILIKDTIFTDIIERDSSFVGYLKTYQATSATAADLPGVQSRPVVVMKPMFTRVQPRSTDTTTVPIGIDSARFRVAIVHRDKNASNLRLRLFALPLTVDSSSDFASLVPYFSGTPVDSVNVSDLLARPAIGDSVTIKAWGDSIRTDSAGHVLQITRGDSALLVYFTLDTIQAPFSVPDSGRVAFGIEVAADSLASIRLGTNESVSNGALIRWFYHYAVPDTLPGPDSVVFNSQPEPAGFDSYVFDPPSAPLDSTLPVGGAPSARSLLRIAMPSYLHDSIDVVRATLVLVSVDSVPGIAADSFQLIARPVLTDFGAKSPIGTNTAEYGATTINTGAPDTVSIELTILVRNWVVDTTRTTALFLSKAPEAVSSAQMRFYSSRTPAFRPALHVTYVKRFPFGSP